MYAVAAIAADASLDRGAAGDPRRRELAGIRLLEGRPLSATGKAANCAVVGSC